MRTMQITYTINLDTLIDKSLNTTRDINEEVKILADGQENEAAHLSIAEAELLIPKLKSLKYQISQIFRIRTGNGRKPKNATAS